MSLILWITIQIKFIAALLAYVNNMFGHDCTPQSTYYLPYDTSFPDKQTRLLLLWGEIRLPHEKKKQEYGFLLTIIGFPVDSTVMSIILPPEACIALVDHLCSFIADVPHC